MKVLVACEESQTVCKAFRARGHEAYSCDIQEPSGGHPEWHILGDALGALRGGWIVTMDMQGHDVGKWDLLIAHPPCTFLSNAGACRLYTEKGHINESRLIKGIQAKDFFMEFWYAPVDHICIENPMPSSIYCLPRRSQEIQPYQFGDGYTKKTFLWLKGLPYLVPTKTASERKPYLPSCTGRKLRGASYGVAHTAKQRSKTFPGIAEAMADQWGNL